MLAIVVLLLAGFPASLAGQARWLPSSTGTTAEFRGLHAVSERVVWASGKGGVVARTGDGGRSWSVDTIPGASALFLVDIHALDDRVAWVAATAFEGLSAGRVFHTTDGARSWTVRYADSTPGIFLDGIAFLDARTGVVFGDPLGGAFLVVRTIDGGATWRPVSGIRADSGEAAFAASGTSISARGRDIWIGTGGGPRARVLHSRDAGESWAAIPTPASGGASKGIFGLAFGEDGAGVAVGGDYQKRDASAENLLITGDGGRTWRLEESPGLAGIQYGVAHAGGRTFVATGPPGSAISTDAGRTWVRIAGPGFNTVSCAGAASRCWAAGTGGRIARLAP